MGQAQESDDLISHEGNNKHQRSGSLGRQRRREIHCPSYVLIINNRHYLNTIVATKRPRASLINPTEKDSDGLLMVQPIDHDTYFQ